MTTEFVLILGLYAFILLGVFTDPDRSPQATFNKSAPRFAAHLERDLAVGKRFNDGLSGGPTVQWLGDSTEENP